MTILGAARLTRAFLPGDPPRPAEVKAVKRHAREVIEEVADRLRWVGPPAEVVGTSSTFRRLARLTGGPSRRAGPFARRDLHRRTLRDLIPELASMTVRERNKLKGVSESRASQILAGAIVAEAAMSAFEVQTLSCSPWAVREGILLQRLDALSGSASMGATRLVDRTARLGRHTSAEAVVLTELAEGRPVSQSTGGWSAHECSPSPSARPGSLSVPPSVGGPSPTARPRRAAGRRPSASLA